MKTKLAFVMMGIGLMLTFSCTKYPPASSRVTEDLAVITQYDTKANFNNYKTFDIATSIIKVTSKDTTMITTPLANSVLNQITTNMKNRGFVQSVSPAMPDLGIEVIYYENTYVYTYYYDYWGYYPYWGYYYPYYPAYYSSYSTGMADIILYDMKYPGPSQKLYIRWEGMIRGLLTGGHSNSDILSAVDQAFIQTPQLKTSAK